MTAPVIRSAWVERSIDDTFRIFTSEIGAWWPLPTHGVFGDRSGGVAFDDDRLVERSTDGSEVVWAEVVTWDPPIRVTLAWHPGRGAEEATTVDISFEATDDGTRVVIEHHGWERLGPDAIERRRSYVGPNAWGAVLDHLADSARADHGGLDDLRRAQERYLDVAGEALAASAPTTDGVAQSDDWTAEQVVAHVALNDLALLQVCQALVHGRPARFENATAQSPEAMQTWLSLSVDREHTMRRATSTAVQLRAALARLSPEQLETTVPCLLTHDGEVVLDGERPWGALAITTQTEMHLPAHTEQLADLTADVVSTHS